MKTYQILAIVGCVIGMVTPSLATYYIWSISGLDGTFSVLSSFISTVFVYGFVIVSVLYLESRRWTIVGIMVPSILALGSFELAAIVPLALHITASVMVFRHKGPLQQDDESDNEDAPDTTSRGAV
ncbi:membrane hypothetical protein [Nitrosopumilaceae archaeon]|nr:membrane hypothetical protein [Nitrosopumilaceae archaeon]